MRCEACGQRLPEAPGFLFNRARHSVRWPDGDPIIIGPIHMDILGAVIDRFPDYVPTDTMISSAWPEGIRDEPENAKGVLRQHVHKLRSKTQIPIWGRSSHGYRLEMVK